MLLAIAVIVLGYVVPHLVRARGVKVDSRVNDRFSQALRLVEVNPPEAHSGSSAMIHASGKQRTEALAMIRPTAPHASRVNARELAASRAACAAEISRRGAAARRRIVALGVLLTATIVLAVLGATSIVHAAYVAIPATLLAGAGYLTVGAEKQRRVADTRSRSQMHRLDQRLRLFRSQQSAEAEPAPAPISFEEILTGGAHAPKVLPDAEPRHARETVETELVEAEPVSDERTAEERAESRRSAREATPWTPSKVPAPAYTLKQEAPKRSVPPVEAGVDAESAQVASPERPTHVTAARRGEEHEAAVTSVDTVLARRRAAAG